MIIANKKRRVGWKVFLVGYSHYGDLGFRESEFDNIYDSQEIALDVVVTYGDSNFEYVVLPVVVGV